MNKSCLKHKHLVLLIGGKKLPDMKAKNCTNPLVVYRECERKKNVIVKFQESQNKM